MVIEHASQKARICHPIWLQESSRGTTCNEQVSATGFTAGLVAREFLKRFDKRFDRTGLRGEQGETD